jgi:arsenate reductase
MPRGVPRNGGQSRATLTGASASATGPTRSARWQTFVGGWVLNARLTDARTLRSMSDERRRVLFVCTHNSARSQMAEGMLRAWAGDRFDAFSAGTEVTQVRPDAIAVMREVGIDISGQRSKGIEEFLGADFEWVITVCDEARQNCPTFPGAGKAAHWSIEDPSKAEEPDDERLEAFRRARDTLRDRLHMFILAGGRADLPAPNPVHVGE